MDTLWTQPCRTDFQDHPYVIAQLGLSGAHTCRFPDHREMWTPTTRVNVAWMEWTTTRIDGSRDGGRPPGRWQTIPGSAARLVDHHRYIAERRHRPSRRPLSADAGHPCADSLPRAPRSKPVECATVGWAHDFNPSDWSPSRLRLIGRVLLRVLLKHEAKVRRQLAAVSIGQRLERRLHSGRHPDCDSFCHLFLLSHAASLFQPALQ